MQAKQDHYPIFEANQVLSNRHLNDVFNYLDEQNRLTRANLIGIGIVCGLDVAYQASPAAVIKLSKGLGISSEGYLLAEPNDVDLVAYRTYSLPEGLSYVPFTGAALWELFPEGEPNTTPISQPANFLNNKVVLLFLELKKAGLRNCSPNNCDDKGSAVTVTLRRLLISKEDVDKALESGSSENEGLDADFETRLAARLNLPDLHLPAFDVPNTDPLSAEDVLTAFFAVFGNELASQTRDALSAAYQAFKPIVDKQNGGDPFGGFDAKFGFLNTVPQTTVQLRFLQYYYDFFDDLLAAYNEFRWQAIDLFCLCSPPEGLFPRHLMLGLVFPEAVTQPGLYRHRFLPSPAVSLCAEQVNTLQGLFNRLVRMIAQFTDEPPLAVVKKGEIDLQIRITPSRLGDVALSAKAIPYYYLQDGIPALFELWSPLLTRRKRADRNLSYRSDEYASQPFVLEPLRYDWEPYNFLRIEGHLGKPYQQVLQALLSQKKSYRLPVEIIALRAGEPDEQDQVDFADESCHFDDLLILYRAYKLEIACAARKAKSVLGGKKIKSNEAVLTAENNALTAVNAKETGGTLGELYKNRTEKPDLDRVAGLRQPALLNAAIYSMTLLDQFEAVLPDDPEALDIEAAVKHIERIKTWTAEIAGQKESGDTEGELDWAQLESALLNLSSECKLEALELIKNEIKRRINEVRKKRGLSHFLKQHPGIRHKAGVTPGGTFILVYHETESVKKSAGFVPRKQSKFGKLVEAALLELQEGAVIADFYLPYLCCSDCAPVQFVLPKTPPVISVDIGCTNSDKLAEVLVSPKGGVTPYRIKLDEQDYTGFEGAPLLLSAGEHSLRIKDAEGIESAALAILIADPLMLGESDFDCVDGNNYVAAVSLQGGTPPYSVNGKVLEGDVFTSGPVASGTPLTIQAADSLGCTETVVVTHRCEPVCNLPCDGMSRRCAYRLWVQPPQREMPYEFFALGSETIRFRFNGKDFEIPGEKVFAEVTAASLNQDFDKTISEAIDRLNQLINEILVQAFGVLDKPRLMLGYKPSADYPFSVFHIDYFVCETFSLEFDFGYAKPAPSFDINVRYTNEKQEEGSDFNGLIFLDRRREKESRVPAFDCRERNQCKGSAFIALCKSAELKPVIQIELAEDRRVILIGEIDGETRADIAAWVWDFINAVPTEPLYTGEKTEVEFEKIADPVKLTVITADGCFFSVESSLAR
ncbi:hypothetical protein GO003_005930 [Methylicorpusculum oleiharenae]|uniref:hypothetical protein n=1 Tax=Methylicorpusculum oleiharenae TaxID=1338687 RepID=UPI001356DFB8|nr:hypothetical protein [Methylicorpusculum oleiharenae]MCD2449923.1 hypothetical protein [Methylicorpusculum oleiharenae]